MRLSGRDSNSRLGCTGNFASEMQKEGDIQYGEKVKSYESEGKMIKIGKFKL